jgi:hypothetical protein
LPAVFGPYGANLLGDGNVVNRVYLIMPNASGCHNAKCHKQNNQKDEKKPEKCFGEIPVHSSRVIVSSAVRIGILLYAYRLNLY